MREDWRIIATILFHDSYAKDVGESFAEASPAMTVALKPICHGDLSFSPFSFPAISAALRSREYNLDAASLSVNSVPKRRSQNRKCRAKLFCKLYQKGEEERNGRRNHLETPSLMMFIVISSVDCGKEIHRIPRKLISAVIGTSLCGREGREHHTFPQRHPSTNDSKNKGSDAEKETLARVVVYSAPTVRHVQFVMTGMKSFYTIALISDLCWRGLTYCTAICCCALPGE